MEVIRPILLVSIFAIYGLVAVSGSKVELSPYVALKAVSIPKIDGKYDTTLAKAFDNIGNTIMVDEWNDTRRQRLYSYFSNGTLGGHAIAEFSMKLDESYLYVLIDFPTNAHPAYNPGKSGELNIDGFSIAFDTKRDGGQLPQPDDYVFAIQYGPNIYAWYARQGTGSGWSGVLDPSSPVYIGVQVNFGVSVTNNEFTGWPHILAEFRFPRTLFGSEGVRSRIFAYDLDTDMIALWPKEALTTRVIDLYGDVTFSTQIIPEFSTFTTAPSSLIILLVLLSTFKSRKRS